MNVGFIHGVMNTDNMQVAGETIDYGPCAFMDVFHPQKTFSSIDQNGRYAWDKQPVIAVWNLTRLAEAMLPLFHGDRQKAIDLAQDELKKFYSSFGQAFESGMAAKFGILKRRKNDAEFIAQALQHMADTQSDFTLFFSSLTQLAEGKTPATDISKDWLALWNARLAEDTADQSARIRTMRAANPVFIARNHRVEQAITAANAGDLEPFNRLVKVLAKPFDDQPENAIYANPPAAIEEVHQTFCGT
jgi:serine/tyrosine/threonine adenylyltransferase